MRRILALWESSLLSRVALWLTLAAFSLLFLDAAGTFEAVYTITISYALLALACAIGLPLVVRGWWALPRPLAAAGLALLVFYVLAAALGGDEVVGAVERASGNRDLAYVGDLALGLGVVGLVCGLVERFGAATQLAIALAAGAVVAALYAIYQWPAQEFGLPLENLNNAVNTSGLTSGDVTQGDALFGWERVRGTFAEPQYIATYLAAMLPVVAAVVVLRSRRRWLVLAACAPLVLAMILTVSTPPWAALAVSSAVGALVLAVGRGAPGPAALAGAGLAIAVLGSVIALTTPGILSGVTGRSTFDLEYTADFRKQEWREAGHSWAERPVLGHGPGQSSVQLAEETRKAATLNLPDTTVVLGSAHGLWAAALVDVGIVGLGLWLALLGGCFVLAARGLADRSGTLALGAFVAATCALISGLISGDRLEVRAWVLIGLMLALLVATSTSEQPTAQGDPRDE